MKNYSKEFWQHVEEQKEKTKIGERVYNWLDHDNLSGIYAENGIFYYELTCSYSTITEEVRQYIKRFMKKKGFQYLYDLPLGR